MQHVEPFTEIGRDRGFDDRAVRLGHQTAHTGELTNLRGRAARAGIGHHEDGIKRRLAYRVAGGAGDELRAELFHHGLRYLIIGMGPDVDDLVVALAGRNEARGVLLFDFLDLLLGRFDDARLVFRHDHIVDADGNAGAGCVLETGIHQAVGEDDRFLQARDAIAGVEQTRYRTLVKHLIDQSEGQASRQQA